MSENTEVKPPPSELTLYTDYGTGVRKYRTFMVGDVIRAKGSNTPWTIVAIQGGNCALLEHRSSAREFESKRVADFQLLNYSILSTIQDQNA